jgi:hypothetical protein
VLEAVNRARIAWETNKHVSRVILCLLAFSGKEMRLPPATLQASNEQKKKAWPELIDIAERITPVIRDFNYMIRLKNHGIKEENLLSLLLPIGVDHSNLDPIFLADMDSFGTMRGAAAHTSSSTVVRKEIDPAEELKRVEGLMPGIESVDALIDSLVEVIPKA